jgi:hypothetical protein
MHRSSQRQGSVKNGWIDEFFENKNKPKGYWDNLERCVEESRKYKNAREFLARGGGAYNMVKKNGWTKLMEYKND